MREEDTSVTEVGQRCGLGSGSYFGRTFREAAGIRADARGLCSNRGVERGVTGDG